MTAGVTPNSGGSDVDRDADVRVGFMRLAEQLEPRLDELAAELTELYREQIPGYADVPADSVRENTRAILDVWLHQVRSGQLPADSDEESIAAHGRRWASMNIPLDLIARSLQLGARKVVAVAREHAAELGFEPAVLYEIQDRAWDWATVNPSVLGDVQREQAVAAARRDAARRADFLRDLASGRLTAGRLTEEAGIYGLDLSHPYFAVCAEGQDLVAGGELESKVRQSGATSEHRVLQTIVEGRFLAVAPKRPTAPAGATLAVGPATLLAEAHASFAEAEQALATARAFAVTGTVDLYSLCPLPIVTAAGRLAAEMSSLRFAELDALGHTGTDIEQTVLTLLDLNQSVEDTATALHLHRNTVRYRVARFRELTGLDLHQTDDLIMTWWLLKWRQIGDRAP
jgi:hypothetical protein